MNEQENQFRIGGFYHQQNGVVAEVTGHSGDIAYVGTRWAPEGKQLHGGGGRRLSDGKYVNWYCADDDKFTLIPGELTQTASGWVALGAEKQEERSLAEAAQDITVTYDEFLALSMTPTLDKLERELRKGEPTSADLAMIARDDTEEARNFARVLAYIVEKDRVAADTPAKPLPCPFPAFRNPDCDSGPSDHLNASRHQMAGMKG